MNTTHIESRFVSHDATGIYHQGWMPESEGDVKAVLAIIHGYAEHGGRYAHVGEFFAGKGYHVEALDHRSHGNSDGKDTFLKSMDACVGDVDQFIGLLKDRYPGLPMFVLGHSMGGLITSLWVEDRKPDINGVLLSSPVVMVDENISPFLVKISGVLAAVAPRLKTIKLDGDAVSRDPREVEKYNSDPLNYRGGIPAATGGAMNAGIANVHRNADRFSLPVRIMHGTADRMADHRGSERLHAGIASEDKTLVLYDGLYHEIFNEPEKQQIMEECLKWTEERITLG